MVRKLKVAFILVGMLAAIALGASTIPVCQRLVIAYTKKLVKNTVSKETQARWDAWNKTHPNFKSKSRPKYKMTTEEVIQKLDFDCQVPTKSVDISIDLVPMSFDQDIPLEADVDSSTDMTTSTDLTYASDTPALDTTTLAGDTPSFGIPPVTIDTLPPVGSTPQKPPSITPVPEPPSLGLTLTGALLIVAAAGSKKLV